MSTTLFVSLAVALGLSACVTDEDETVPPDDQEIIADPGAEPGEPTDPNVLPDPESTCGGQARSKADGPCVP